MSTYYDEYRNDYYNPDDVEEQPGDNQNWKMIQKGFDSAEYMDKPATSYIQSNVSSVTIESGKSVVLTFAVPDRILSLPVKGYYLKHIDICKKDGVIISNAYVKTVKDEIIRFNHSVFPANAFSADTVTINVVVTNYTDADITFDRADITLQFDFFPSSV